MARFELKLPKMGESVAEATITSWLKEVGDTIELDEAVVEIATDKVDSEIPSEVEGTLTEILFEKDAIVAVGETIAIIETDGGDTSSLGAEPKNKIPSQVLEVEKTVDKAIEVIATPITKNSDSGKFYSPLVRNIAQKEGISMEVLETISGSGKDERVTKDDILVYLENRGKSPEIVPAAIKFETPKQVDKVAAKVAPISVNGEDEIIEMSRMGKLIAKHMVNSVQTSAHVQSFIEIDVTNIVTWRAKVKDGFLKREGEKLTFTPILMQAIATTIRKYPLINIAIDGENIIKKKNIKIGRAHV
jgi:2-oxoglutarate dehydrogenase E2 component (dihydrolipoamide succinyltransferase)